MYEFEYDYEGKQRRKAIALSAVIQFIVLFVLIPIVSLIGFTFQMLNEELS